MSKFKAGDIIITKDFPTHKDIVLSIEPNGYKVRCLIPSNATNFIPFSDEENLVLDKEYIFNESMKEVING